MMQPQTFHNNREFSYKVIILGDSNTGKTSLLERFVYDQFGKTNSTVGIDFLTKRFEIDEFSVLLNIFDTAGQQQYQSICKNYCRGSDAILFTYSLTDKKSFINIPKWIKYFTEICSDSTVVKVLLGTKKDLLKEVQQLTDTKDSQFSIKAQNLTRKEKKLLRQKFYQLNPEIPHKDEVKEFLEREKFVFSFETSAKLNIKINEVFEELCRHLIVKTLKARRTSQSLKQQEVIEFYDSMKDPQKLKKEEKDKSTCC